MTAYSDLFKPGEPLELFKNWPAPLTCSSLLAQWLGALRTVFVPAAFSSQEAARRYAHQDLPHLSDIALWQELERARFLLVWLDSPDPWLSERYKVVQSEQQRRKVAS